MNLWTPGDFLPEGNLLQKWGIILLCNWQHRPVIWFIVPGYISKATGLPLETGINSQLGKQMLMYIQAAAEIPVITLLTAGP